MSERERLLDQIADAIANRQDELNKGVDMRFQGPIRPRDAAEAALRVLEAPVRSQEAFYVHCTCGQNGYSPTSPHSNHPHLEGCPHFEC